MDYALLGLGEATSLIKEVYSNEDTGSIRLSCIYDPANKRLPYQLVFEGCREIQWDRYVEDDRHPLSADVVGLSLGSGKHCNPAVITTDEFELSFLYDRFILEKEW